MPPKDFLSPGANYAWVKIHHTFYMYRTCTSKVVKELQQLRFFIVFCLRIAETMVNFFLLFFCIY